MSEPREVVPRGAAAVSRGLDARVEHPPSPYIELRSDTFTLPTPEMLQAIAAARLGDECYGEDPTVRELETLAAAKLGKEAACLMPSGTMANLASVLGHCPDGGGVRVLVGDRSDIWAYEDGSVAKWAGITYEALPTSPRGRLSLAEIGARCNDGVASRVALVCLENPHNLCGGAVLGADDVRAVADVAHGAGARLHLDGARLFNAATRLRVAAAEIARAADSVQVCLSKGLCAPIGSVVAGSGAFVERARSMRKRLGGDMHQAGVVAAAGIVALERMVERLEEDHEHARRLAEGLSTLPGIELDLEAVQTNTVVFRVVDPRFDAEAFIDALWRRGVRVSEFRYGRLRAVLHHGIGAPQVDQVLALVAQLVGGRSGHAAPV